MQLCILHIGDIKVKYLIYYDNALNTFILLIGCNTGLTFSGIFSLLGNALVFLTYDLIFITFSRYNFLTTKIIPSQKMTSLYLTFIFVNSLYSNGCFKILIYLIKIKAPFCTKIKSRVDLPHCEFRT